MASNSVRTDEELNNPQFNYFIAFKLDINETNPEVIEQAVKKRLNFPGGDVRTRRLIELKNDIIEIMCNDAVFDGTEYVPHAGGRKQEADRALELKLNEAVTLVQNICAMSGRKDLELGELEKIRAGAMGYFTLTEFKNRLEALPLGIKVSSTAQRVMLFGEYSKIEDYLTIVNKKDLYDFLGVSNTASTAEITSASNLAYANGIKATNLSLRQAVSGLCMCVKKLLLTSDYKFRTYYDYYLKLKDSVWKMLALRRSYGLNALTAEEHRAFIQIIVNAVSVDEVEAEMIFAVGCKYYNISVS